MSNYSDADCADIGRAAFVRWRTRDHLPFTAANAREAVARYLVNLGGDALDAPLEAQAILDRLVQMGLLRADPAPHEVWDFEDSSV